MANTVTQSGRFINIVCDGTTDWNGNTLFPAGVVLRAIKFLGSLNDVIKFRNGSASGVFISAMKDTAGGGLRDNIAGGEGLYCVPFFHPADCTVTSWPGLLIILEVEAY